MSNLPISTDYKLQKASERDWDEILLLLHTEHLQVWFTGKENHRDFYIVREPSNRKIICCFAIDQEKNIGILKSFVIIKELQGKGIGKKISSEIPSLCKKLKIDRLYAVTIDTPGFWNKTFFDEINLTKIQDGFLLKYLCNFIDKVEKYLEKIHVFLAKLS